jgi:Leucine-rich repeat (LRR) protein
MVFSFQKGVGKLGRAKIDFDSIIYPFDKKTAIHVWCPELYDEYVWYINKHRLTQAKIVMPSLDILYDCPTLQYLHIHPRFDSPDEYDFTPLYGRELKYLCCLNEYYKEGGKSHIGTVDFSQIFGLESLKINVNRGTLNYNRIETLKSLIIGDYTGANRDLTELFISTELDTLRLLEGRTVSLNGIEKAHKLQCLDISYNRCLEDISALAKVKDSLKSLNIFNCARIKDFSVLYELENLEKLEIWGSNTIPSLDFVKYMPNLKTLFLEINIADGDITPCLGLRSAKLMKDRKHYNLKDKDLPKARKAVFGNESIDEWRRLE